MIEITGRGRFLIARVFKKNYENEVQIFSYVDHPITFTDFLWIVNKIVLKIFVVFLIIF